MSGAPPIAELTAEEVDELSHLFYRVTNGRLTSIEVFRSMLVKASLTVPDDLIHFLFHSAMHKNQEIHCAAFLEITSIIKSLDLWESQLSLQKADAAVREEEKEMNVLFERLKSYEVEKLPASVIDLLKNKRQIALQRAHDHHHHHHHAAPAESPEKEAANAQLDAYAQVFELLPEVPDEPRKPKCDDSLGAVTSIGGCEVEGVMSQASGSTYGDDNPRDEDPRVHMLEYALILLNEAENSQRISEPNHQITHYSIRQELANFGLAPPGWDEVKPVEALGVEVDVVEGATEQPPPQLVRADPLSYLPIDKDTFGKLFFDNVTARAAVLGNSPSRLRAGWKPPPCDPADGSWLVDLQDDGASMSDLTHALLSLQLEADSSARRPETSFADQSDSESYDVPLVEDPISGDLVPVEQQDDSGARIPGAMRAASFSWKAGRPQSVNEKKELSRLVMLERDLFLSPAKKRALDEVGDFFSSSRCRGGALTSAEEGVGGVMGPLVSSRGYRHGTATSNDGQMTPAGAPSYPVSARPQDPHDAGPLKTPHDDSHHTPHHGTTHTSDEEVRKKMLTSTRHRFPSQLFNNDGTTSTSSTSVQRRLHPLLNKLRQIIHRRLEGQKLRLMQHHFPVTKRAEVHSGLTPTQQPLTLSSKPPAALSDEAKKAWRIQERDRHVEDHKRRVLQQSEEHLFQKRALDSAFPACDMTYGDFFFVPQLTKRPPDTPLYFVCDPPVVVQQQSDPHKTPERSSSQRRHHNQSDMHSDDDENLVLNRQNMPVVPGIVCDVATSTGKDGLLRQHLAPVTATHGGSQASLHHHHHHHQPGGQSQQQQHQGPQQPSSKNLFAYRTPLHKDSDPVEQFHNHELLVHSFVAPYVPPATREASWVARLSPIGKEKGNESNGSVSSKRAQSPAQNVKSMNYSASSTAACTRRHRISEHRRRSLECSGSSFNDCSSLHVSQRVPLAMPARRSSASRGSGTCDGPAAPSPSSVLRTAVAKALKDVQRGW